MATVSVVNFKPCNSLQGAGDKIIGTVVVLARKTVPIILYPAHVVGVKFTQNSHKPKPQKFLRSFFQKATLFLCKVTSQNNPEILPLSSTSIFSAEGTLGRPGMVIISPVRATIKPAPADTLTFLMVTVKPSGAPTLV